MQSRKGGRGQGEARLRQLHDDAHGVVPKGRGSDREGGEGGENDETETRRPLSQSPDAEGVVGPSMMEALDLLVKDFNRLSVTMDGDKEVTSPFPLTNARAGVFKEKEDVLLRGAREEGERNKRLHLPVDDQGTSHLRDLRPKSQDETSAIFDSLIAQINEARDSVSPQSPVPKEGKFPSGGVVKAQSAPHPFVGNPMVEVVRPSPPDRSKRSKKYPSPLKINHRSEGTPPPHPPPPATATLATLHQGAPERRRKHSLPTIKMLGNSTDSASTQISTSSSSTSLDTFFLYRLSSASVGSHDDPEAMLALKTLVRMSSNRECLATIVSYVCLPKFTSKLLGVPRAPTPPQRC